MKLTDLAVVRRALANAWRSGYNHGWDDGDAIGEWHRNGALGYRRAPEEPEQTPNPYSGGI